MIYYILTGVVSLLLGIIIGLLIEGSRTVVGTMIVDESDEAIDTYRIEIDNLDDIPKKKRIILKISNSQK